MSGTLKHLQTSTVQITCRPNTEVSIKEEEVLLCQVIDHRIENGGEPVAIKPLKVSITSAFSRYNITPAREINFDPLVYGSKTSQSFTIENSGVFKTRFMIMDPAAPRRKGTSKDSDSEKLSYQFYQQQKRN